MSHELGVLSQFIANNKLSLGGSWLIIAIVFTAKQQLQKSQFKFSTFNTQKLGATNIKRANSVIGCSLKVEQREYNYG